MFRILMIIAFLAAVPLTAAPVFAEETKSAIDNATFDRRLELAKTMHELQPTADKVNQAIDAASRHVPAGQQEAFKTAMRGVLNYQAIEKISIDAMVDTYSIEELEMMVNYYSTDEAKSIAAKFKEYEAKVSPEVARMLDKAMMRVRTGGMSVAP